MNLLRWLCSRVPHDPPRSVTLDGLGEFTEESYHSWVGIVRIDTLGEDFAILFMTDGEPPGEREAAAWKRIADQWPSLWQSLLEELRSQLYFDTEEAATAFFAAMRPTGLLFFDVAVPGEEKWDIVVQPEYSDHLLTLNMRGMRFETYGLDG